MKHRPDLLLVLALAGAAACHSTPPEQPDTRPPVAVTTEAAALTELADSLEAGGVVTAQVSAAVSSRIMATVTQLRVKAGDRVAAGQVLVVLDDRDLAAGARQTSASTTAAEQALVGARTDQAAAESEASVARAWHARIKSLHDRQAATTQELDDAVARLTAAEARLAGARARIQQAEAGVTAARASGDVATTTRSFATVRAPFAGLVTETMTEPGNLAAPGVPLVRIDSAGALRVEVTVDEARAAYVHAGDKVAVLLEGPGSREPVQGVVAEVARTVTTGSRAFTVKVTLPGERSLRTGTFARVRFQGAPRQSVTVPAAAVRRNGQVATVFVVQDGVARLRLVHTGVAGDRVEVLAGLDAGEPVVVNPPPTLTDGQRVTPRGRAEERP